MPKIKVTDEEIIDACKNSSTLLEASKKLGMTYPNIRRRAIKLGYHTSTKNTSTFSTPTDAEIISTCGTVNSMIDAAKLLNMSYSRLRREAKRLGCYNPNVGGKGVHKPKTKGKIPLDDILSGVYTKRYGSSKLKARLIDEGYKQHTCEECGLSEWRGEHIALHLHHIDGDRNNNKLENLQILCPNCHSQTHNYAGKSSGVSNYNKVTDDQILRELKVDHSTIIGVLRRLGLCTKGNYGNRVKRVASENNISIQSINMRGIVNTCSVCGKPITKDNVSGLCVDHYNEQRSTKRPPRDILLSELNSCSYVAVGKKYGVSDNAVRKWVKYYENN